MIQNYFHAMVMFRNLLNRHTGKEIYRKIRSAKEVLMLLDAILYDIDSFEHFCKFGEDSEVYLKTDNKKKIVEFKIGRNF